MYKILDLFSGAGGLSLGFTQTGEFKVVAAAEKDKNARETYLQNHGDILMINDVVGYDFKKLRDSLDGIDVIIGGPPCQGFSNANRQKSTLVSMNNSLVKEYFRAIKEVQPKAFIMENVSMLQSDKHRFFDTVEDHESMSYLAIDMIEEEILLSNQIFNNNMDLLSLVQDPFAVDDLILPPKLQEAMRCLYRYRNKPDKMEKYTSKHDVRIIHMIEKWEQGVEVSNSCSFYISGELNTIKSALSRSLGSSFCIDALRNIIEFQKMLLLTQELYLHGIYCRFENKVESNQLICIVNSYAVIDYINAILDGEYKQSGYILNASDFGVPQERKRYIVFGIRQDIAKDIEILPPEKTQNGEAITVGDAILDLINVTVGYDKESPAVEYLSTDMRLSTYVRGLRYDGLLFNHIATKSTEIAIKRFKALGEGDNFHKLPIELIDSYDKPERTQNTIYLRLDSTKPAGTVVNVRKSMWIHPKLDRALSVREAARLQSFPDSFIFCGTKDSQYQQVGNAVPPMLAKAIAMQLLKYLSIKK
jgi:DNA (cytosine-5)-methyltransferase 1